MYIIYQFLLVCLIKIKTIVYQKQTRYQITIYFWPFVSSHCQLGASVKRESYVTHLSILLLTIDAKAVPKCTHPFRIAFSFMMNKYARMEQVLPHTFRLATDSWCRAKSRPFLLSFIQVTSKRFRVNALHSACACVKENGQAQYKKLSLYQLRNKKKRFSSSSRSPHMRKSGKKRSPKKKMRKQKHF